MTITEFLLARIGEDEAAAERGGYHNGGGTFANDNYGCLLIQPARVLAECAAKRAIIEQRNCSDKSMSMDDWSMGWSDGNYAALYALAAVYKEHHEYQKEWEL